MIVREGYAREVGRNVLKELDINFVPIDLIEICRQKRILVDWTNKIDVNCDAVTFYNPTNKRHGIYLKNKYTCHQRYTFTLAHELSHCLLNHFIDYDLSFINCPDLGSFTAWALNREANICTEEILMPLSFIQNRYYMGFDFLKKSCGVSIDAMRIRLEYMGIEIQDTGPPKTSMYQKTIFK